MSPAPPHLDIHPTVAAALAAGDAVVALESTIITHGMPWPHNAEMAATVEAIVAEEGAVAATIAVVDGQLKIGLNEAERTGLARRGNAMKLSRADLAFAVAEGLTGGTTVAATMIAAHLAGIPVFATGGIGGVHKGAETSFDISADIEELARTPVIVVSAGPKAILDIAKTLEVLETRGVPVIGYGTDVMPAFWSRHSPFPAPLRLDTAAALARFHTTRRNLGLEGGMLVANPITAEAEVPAAVMEGHVAEAQRQAHAAGIAAKDVTPYLLERIYEMSEGASLKANIALVKGNARLAAQVARALAAGGNDRSR